MARVSHPELLRSAAGCAPSEYFFLVAASPPRKIDLSPLRRAAIRIPRNRYRRFGQQEISVMASNAASGGDDSPSLTLPASENMSSDGTVAVTGANYSDSFAQSNPGSMYIGISDESGLLYAWYPGTNGEVAVSGFGSDAISFSGSYADVQAIINSLTYVATVNSGSDDIHYDAWNQAGVETTGDVPVTIQPVAASDTWLGTVSADWNAGANWSAGAPPVSGDSVAIPAGTPFDASLANATLNGETIILAGGASPAPTLAFSNVTLDSALSGTGTIDIGGTLTIGATGTLGLRNSSALAAASPATIVNDGTIVSASGDHLFIDNGGTAGGNGTLINNGIIEANGGEIAVQLNASGTQPEVLRNAGTVAIADGGSVWMNGTIAGGDIAFNGTGALTLQQASGFADGATITGFGQADQIDLYGANAGKGGTLSFAGGTLDISLAGTAVQAIPLTGSYTLGNFEVEDIAGSGNSSVIAYAPDDGPTGIVSPDIIAPAADMATQGATLALNDVSIDAPGTTQAGVTIVAQSGTLFMGGATGSGTRQITVGLTAISQINADLASLTYDPAPGATNDVVSITTSPPAPVETTRSIPISIDSGPGLHEPSGETVAAGGTVAVSGSYVDGFAQHNPGELYLGISDSSGTLHATDAAGNPLAGSGTNAISLGTDYNDLNAALASLKYVATPGAGSDSINFDIWNQAGVRTTGSVPVTVTAGGAGGGRTLNEPSAETVSPGGTVAVTGGYSDSFAQSNPGSMFLGISDGSGMLRATDASGQAVAGSGTNNIGVSGDYVDVNAILASLRYTAGSSAGSDTIQFQVWNQAGVDTTGATAVTVRQAAASIQASTADFVGPGALSPDAMAADTGAGASASLMLGKTHQPPIGVPLTLHP
jgi:hypothetical protein